MILHTLTGRKRHRTHKPFGKPILLVLQLELHVTGYEVLDAYGGCVERDDYVWRDATTADLTTEGD